MQGTAASSRPPQLHGRASTASAARRAASVLSVRAIEALVVVVALASLVFFALRLIPGDPARLVLGDEASAAELARVHAALHTDEPMLRQYVRFLEGLATLDLGDSLRRPGVRAMAIVLKALAPTGRLAAAAVAMGALAGLLLAILASGPWLAVRARAWLERALVGVAAVPLVAFAPVVTWALAARARILPLPGDPDAGVRGLLFASALLAIPLAAHVGRIARAALRGVEDAAFLTATRAKGADPWRVWVVHALPTVAGPIVTVVAAQLGALLGGAVVLERMFERWGLGTLVLEAYATRDLPVLEGAIVAAGLLFVAAQALGTAVHFLVDPQGTVRAMKLGRACLDLSPLGALILVSAVCTWTAEGPAGRLEPARAWCSPSWERPIGCGEAGVDLATLVSSAELRAIALASLVALAGFAVGTPVGAAAALARGRCERATERACDLVQAFPSFLLALAVLSAVRAPSRLHIGAVFALTAWAPFARLALAQTRVLRDAPFVEAAIALGVGRLRVLGLHIMPNLLGVVAVQLGSTAAAVVVSEASLGFVGFGPRNGVSLGNVLDQGVAAMLRAPHVLLVGAIAVAAASASLLVAGRAVER